ncbi:MAG: low temperature requirement protein A [Pseudomonadota bacterium]
MPAWWIWATHTLYSNRFDTDSRGHRIASLVIMFLRVTMSAFIGAGLSGNSAYFIGFYIAIRAVPEHHLIHTHCGMIKTLYVQFKHGRFVV